MMNRNEEEKEANSERWALTYSDMITLLLVLFILMYTMSTVDAEKYKSLATELSKTFKGATQNAGKGPGLGSGDGLGIVTDTSSAESGKDGSSSGSSSSDSSSAEVGGGTGSGTGSGSGGGTGSGTGGVQVVSNFDELYEVLKNNIEDKGYGDKIIIERDNSSIHFKFKDSVLFYPDSTNMRDEGKSVLQYVSKTLSTVNNLYKSVRIEGHTADIGVKGKSNFPSWELSSDRALAVLEYMISESGLAEEKMSIAGFSHYSPIANNNTEAGKATNRRVEITVTSAKSKTGNTSSTAQTGNTSSIAK